MLISSPVLRICKYARLNPHHLSSSQDCQQAMRGQQAGGKSKGMTINVAAPGLGCTAIPQQPTSAGKPPFLPGSLSLPVGDKLSRGLVWQPDSSQDGWCVTGLGCLGCAMLGYIAASSCPLPTGAVDRSCRKPLFRNLNLEARHFNLGFSFESVVLRTKISGPLP